MMRLPITLSLLLILSPKIAHATARAIMEGIAASATTIFVDTANVRIGIGTVSPNRNLEVSGNSPPAIRVNATQVGHNSAILELSNSGIPRWAIGLDPAQLNNTDFAIRSVQDNKDRFIMRTDGSIGISTNNPTSKLTIFDGDIQISTSTGSRGIIFQDGTTQTTAIRLTSNNTWTGANTFNSSVTVNGGLFGTPFGAWISWVPTFGGFSSNPINYVAKYIRIGKLVIASYTAGTASTSNATNFTITLPFTIVGVQRSNILAFDNGAWISNGGSYETSAGTTTLNLYTGGNFQAWTASGRKDAGFIIMYETSD